jgi:hypothetical protein
MLKFVAAAIAVGSIAIVSTAMAGEPAGSQKTLSLAQLRTACANPAAFQSQRPPSAIRVTCEDKKLTWQVEQGEGLEIDNQRQITTALTSDKYNVARESQLISVPVTSAMCPRFREYEITYTKSLSLSCQELQAFQGSLGDFCMSAVDSDLKANAALATKKATGRTHDVCPSEEKPSEGITAGQQGVKR